MEGRKRLNHIESIRALAAISVALFHFTNFYAHDWFLVNSQTVRNAFVYGAQGVEIFYVISGFIIPYSLYKRRYQLQHYFHYLGKRLTRLLPPYYVTIGLILALNFVLCKVLWGIPFDLQIRNLIANAFFAVDFIAAFEWLSTYFPDNAWINPIFETLKVELQFYLLIGLVFPFINKRKVVLVIFCLALLTLGIATRNMNTVLVNSPYFVLGIATFYVFEKGWSFDTVVLVAVCFGTLLNFYQWYDALAALIAVALVLYLPTSFSFLNFTGKISYSYYLIHGLAGGQLIYFMRETTLAENHPVILIILALLVSWIAAFLIYFCIEKPSLVLSKRIKYKHKKQ